MRLAIIRRALAATAALTLLSIPVVLADSVAADHDLLQSGIQGTIDLGTVAGGAEVPFNMWFVLACTGTSHVDSTQAVRVTPSLRSFPMGGSVHVGTLTFGLGSAWPADGQPCPTDLQPTVGGPLVMSVTAPPNPGHYTYRFTWIPTVIPSGSNDASAFAGNPIPALTVTLDVADATPPPNTPPTLHLPANMTVAGNTTGGATVSYTATATDAEDAVAPAVSCSKASGSLFPFGTTTVSCSATDSGGLQATGTFSVSVTDTPPTLHLPANMTVEGNTTGGATVSYTATATDTEDSVAPTVSCGLASGAFFAIGTTTVNCSATDSGGLTTTGSFQVTVEDTTPPTLHMPANLTVEGNTVGGATVSYVAPTASDVVDAAPTVSCSQASGSFFALGPTTVSCSATDSGGLQASGTFTVSVVDTTDPTLARMPGDVTLTTADPSGATLNYTGPTASDVVDASPTVSCSPASGSTVPVGDTTVTCTGQDASGNTASASFTAHVRLASAIWEDPAAGGLVVNGSRTVPIKVGLSLDGTPITAGSAMVSVIPCGGGAAVQTDGLDLQSNGRWMGHLSTDGIAAGCYQVVASANGVAIGSFRMDVRADSSPASKPASTPKNGPKK